MDPRDGGASQQGPWDVSHGTFQCNRHYRVHGLSRVSSDINVVQSCVQTSNSYNLQIRLGTHMILHKVRKDPTDRTMEKCGQRHLVARVESNRWRSGNPRLPEVGVLRPVHLLLA